MNTPCIEWEGFIDTNGYGKLGSRWAHRVAYAKAHGEIPKGLEVMHTCNNKPCVNVDHLKLGTHAENMAAASVDGLMVSHDHNGDRNPNAKISSKQVEEIQAARSHGMKLKQIAAKFGITFGQVGKIIRGEAWRFR